MVFHGELGHNYLAIKDVIENKQLPLIGPPTSHSWLNFGPLFYWTFIPVMLISNYQPLGGAIFFAFVGLLTVYLNYKIVSKIISRDIAIISSFIIAISPAWIAMTRDSRFFSLVVPLIYLFLWFFINSIKGKNIDYFIWGLIVGIILNFHLSPIILFPTIFLLFMLGVLNWKKGILSFVGIVIPTIPLILYDSGHGFQMLSNLAKWIPYRMAGFLGFIPKNNINSDIALINLKSLFWFFGYQLTFESILITTILAIMLIYFIVFAKKKFVLILSLLFIVIGYIGIFIHGDPPSHYFLPLMPFVVVLISQAIYFVLGRNISVIIVSLIAIFNMSYFFSDKWFYLPQDQILKNVPYSMQTQVVKEIIEDSQEKEFSISRQGPYDYFDKNYSQNYEYLFWLYGRPVITESSLHYTIIENSGGGLSLIKAVK